MNSTEEFCKKRALHNALLLAVEKYDSGDETGQIPDILQKALGVSFDTHIGHDYFEDAAARFEFYNRADNKIPFDIDLLNKITNGGVSKKTMNLLIASTGVGKSMGLCHLSAAYINEGYNVLYISLEMAEEALAERIDANLFDVDIALVRKLSESNFNEKVNKTRKKASGKLIFKEYPTGSAHSGHFRHLLSELKTKKKFIPDVLVIDYLNICASAKFKTKTSMYEYVKSIAEELRGLAVEHDLILWTATQTNREGYSTSDFDLTAVSESMGISHTCDIILALISTDELEQQKLLKVKQLKNRYGDKNYYGSFVVGIDRSKMRIMDAEASAQTTVSQTENDTREKPVEDKKAKIAAMFGS
jgi:predicted ATP-dependent serine protease